MCAAVTTPPYPPYPPPTPHPTPRRLGGVDGNGEKKHVASSSGSSILYQFASGYGVLINLQSKLIFEILVNYRRDGSSPRRKRKKEVCRRELLVSDFAEALERFRH